MSYPTASLVRMGLAVGTHAYAYSLMSNDDPEYLADLRNELEALNALLASEGLPAHQEPETYGPVTSREEIGSLPYSFVHYLRRAYARAVENPGETLAPVADGEDPTGDPAVEALTYMFESHLICHSDCEGYYVPVDFDMVLYPDDDIIPGGMVGSTQGLLRELIYVAPYIGITMIGAELAETDLAVLRADHTDTHPFYRERETWFLLYESARVSLGNNTLIHFG